MSETRYSDAIINFIEECLEKNVPIKVSDFVEKEKDLILQCTLPGDDLASTWTTRLGKAAAEMNAPVTKSSVDWGRIALNILRNLPKERDEPSDQTSSKSGPSVSTNTTSSTASKAKKLSYDDQAKIKEIFSSLDKNKMWHLKSGKVVEMQMKELALQSEFEHPCHSLILDPSDKIWEEYFTKAELSEIKKHKLLKVNEMPPDLTKYLLSFKGYHTLEELSEHNDSFKFNRKSQAGLYWLHQSIVKGLDLYFFNYLLKKRTECDLLKRIWGFIECCFDGSVIDVFSGEITSKASAERKNESR